MIVKIFIVIISILISSCYSYHSDNNGEISGTNNPVYFSASGFIVPEGSCDDTIIVVKTAKELLKAMGSNRTIQLNAGKFTLNDSLGIGLDLDSLFNLKLVGVGPIPVKIHQEDPLGHVITFENCGNIILENLDMGHYPDPGSCEANVLNLSNCKSIEIKNCMLFGTGQIGINADNISNLTCTNIVVYDCSLNLLNLSDTKEILFNKSKFINAETNYSALVLSKCFNVTFQNCQFKNIRVTEEEMHFDEIVEAYEIKNILFDSCEFDNNRASGLTGGFEGDLMIFRNCTYNKNHFIK